MAIRGFALACVMQPTQAAALSVIERDVLTRASSLLSVMRSVFQSLGVAILGTVLQLRGTPASGFQGAYTIARLSGCLQRRARAAMIGVVLAIFLPIKPRRPAEVAGRAEPQHGACGGGLIQPHPRPPRAEPSGGRGDASGMLQRSANIWHSEGRSPLHRVERGRG